MHWIMSRSDDGSIMFLDIESFRTADFAPASEAGSIRTSETFKLYDCNANTLWRYTGKFARDFRDQFIALCGGDKPDARPDRDEFDGGAADATNMIQ